MHKQPLLVIDGGHLVGASGNENCIPNVALQALGADRSHGSCELPATGLVLVLLWNFKNHEILQQLPHG
jgi:hypothetical protein